MSLVQDALQRQRADDLNAGRTPSPQASPPARPPPLPGAPPALPTTAEPPAAAESTPAEPEPEVVETHPRFPLWLVVRAVLMIWILGSLGIWLMFTTIRLTAARALASTPATTSSSTGAAISTPPESLTPAASSPSPAVGTAPIASNAPATASAAASTATPFVDWPHLRVTGVVGNDQRGAAMINGRLIVVGDTIDGVEVLAVSDHGVRLSYQGESLYAKVGLTIE